jgi:hypothetical protein
LPTIIYEGDYNSRKEETEVVTKLEAISASLGASSTIQEDKECIDSIAGHGFLANWMLLRLHMVSI